MYCYDHHLGVVRGAGGHHHVPPRVGEVLAQAAVVPASGAAKSGRGGAACSVCSVALRYKGNTHKENNLVKQKMLERERRMGR